VTNPLVEFYRCPAELVSFVSPEQYHHDAACSYLSEVASNVSSGDSNIVDDLRFERYNMQSPKGTGALLASEAVRSLYYCIRPTLSDSLRRTLQRFFFRDWDQLPFPRWPVDTSVEDIFEQQLLMAMKNEGMESIPFIWFWPNGATSAAVMTHDVEASSGLAMVPRLIDIDDEFGIKTSFQIVPERRYTVSNNLLEIIRQRKCEVNVHGLNHDGNLFSNRKAFSEQAKRINKYLQEFGAEGFRSGCMYRNVDWYEELNISYDMSVPNVAHLEPQRGGCCTVFPYFIRHILELPLTTVQDYSLFHIIGDYSLDLWKQQIEVIAGKHGLLSFIIHPDYIFADKALAVYKELLSYLSHLGSARNVWIARAGDINRWWRERSAMKLVFGDGMWRIEGCGREQARIGFAYVKDNRIAYRAGQSCEPPLAHELERTCIR
jgi:hypothetical protein